MDRGLVSDPSGLLRCTLHALTSPTTKAILTSAMSGFFTKGRRELISKTFATLVQIAIGAMFASNILMRLTTTVKVTMITGVILLFCLVAICPPRSDE